MITSRLIAFGRPVNEIPTVTKNVLHLKTYVGGYDLVESYDDI